MSSVVTSTTPASRGRVAMLGLAFAYGALLVLVAPAMPLPLLAATLGLAGAGLWLSHADLANFRIPDGVSLVILALVASAVAWSAPDRLLPHALAGLAGLAALWLLGAWLCRRTGRDALGLGDAKLFGAAGLWVGLEGLSTVLLLGSLRATAHAVLSGRARSRVPFGRSWALAIYAVWLHGPLAI